MDIERLTVKVHLLGEPCLWCWEIVDVEDGRGCSSLAFLRHYRRTSPERLRQHHQRRKGVQATRI